MEKLIIEATVNSPRIVLDPEEKKFEFSGESRPENVRNFYLPVLEWLEKYDIQFDELCFSSRKEIIDCDVYLDDDPICIERLLEHNKRIVIRDQAWNRHISDIERVKSLADFYDLLRK